MKGQVAKIIPSFSEDYEGDYQAINQSLAILSLLGHLRLSTLSLSTVK